MKILVHRHPPSRSDPSSHKPFHYFEKNYNNFLILKDTEIMKILNHSENKALHTHYIKYATELLVFSRKENNEIFSKPSLRL